VAQTTVAPGLAVRAQSSFARSPTSSREQHSTCTPGEHFTRIQPGGKREPLAYDPNGYFIITLDRAAGEIVVRHHLTDNSPAHEVRGRSGEPLLLGLLREGLISQLSHAGYLGAELARAEAALRLKLRYEQDQPLRPGPV